MRVLYFDCFSGISGDMTLGALINLGVDEAALKNELGRLNLQGYDISVSTKLLNGIAGTDVHVHMHEHTNGHSHSHEHPHGQHEGDACHHHGGHEHSHGERNLKSIVEMIDSSGLKDSVKDFSKKVFYEIAAAEGRVHNKDINEVHFHEVGAVDSIADIVGCAVCLDMLGVERVYSSPLHDGRGFIKCQHGTIPVPVPAVMEMLKNSNIPVVSEDISTELVTPTGMGIIKCLSAGFGRMPSMSVEGVGYGMGKRDTGGFNALRVVMGTLYTEDAAKDEEIVVLETNMDDISAEILGYTLERLIEKGALDAFFTPIYMKKNRPAYMLTALCRPENEQRLCDIILAETTTLGIRKSNVRRCFMERETISVHTEYGDVRVKAAYSGGVKKAAPEYEDCREIARRTGMPVREVYELVLRKLG